MIMMSGDCPVPGSSPALPIAATLPTAGATADPPQLANGPPSCTGCGQPIQDEFILRVQGHFWHAQCLRCAACQTTLTQMCFVRGTRVFCRIDFFRLFGAGCAGCGEVIPPSDVVRRAGDNVYHLRCFACLLCGTALQTGDQFYLRHDGRLICKADFHSATQLSQNADKQDGGMQEGGNQEPTSAATNLNGLSFTPQETEILQEVYRACPNPSHDTLQRISSQHGLDSTRVRVWFHVHRKEKAAADCGNGYGPNDVTCHVGMGADVAVAPPGGYPLPIVNEASASSAGRLPTSSRSALADDVILGVAMTSAGVKRAWPVDDDVLRPDFVPPNVDLNPCDIHNGEVCDSRRGTASLSPRAGAGDEFCPFTATSGDKGDNGFHHQPHHQHQHHHQHQPQQQQQQLQHPGPEMSLSWINC